MHLPEAARALIEIPDREEKDPSSSRIEALRGGDKTVETAAKDA